MLIKNHSEVSSKIALTESLLFFLRADTAFALEHLQWSITISIISGSTPSSLTSSSSTFSTSSLGASVGFSAFLNFPASELAKF